MVMEIEVKIADPEFVAGVLVAAEVRVAPTPPTLALRNALHRTDELLRHPNGEFPTAAVKDAIRDMLRKGGFRPAGRNKPASEYLAQAAREGRFPRINNLVDVINLLALESGLPISLLDLNAVGPSAEIRYGREGEKYVFNASGQELDLAGLICVCRTDPAASTPLGSPIKDSMAGKITDQTTGVLAVIYGSTRAIDEPAMESLLVEFGQLMEQYATTKQTERQVLRGAAA